MNIRTILVGAFIVVISFVSALLSVLSPIALSAIRDALDAQAPRNLSGKPQNPVSPLLSNAELNFNIARGPLTVTGRPDALVAVTPLTGQFQAAGTIASGRPVLEQDRQVLRFSDVALDVQSQAAFGLPGAAAQAATPYLQKLVADKAVIDLKPFAADAKQRIAAAVSGFVAPGSGMSANLAVNDLRLTGIAYDDNTLRVIANATGVVNVALSSLSMQ